jgi:hypothetical protein
MNRLVKQLFFIFTITLAGSFLLTSCEKEVHINLASSPPTVVVQGQIETGYPPLVVLTSTISFFSNIDLNTLQNSFLHDAIVTVRDSAKTITLREYSFDTGANNKFYVYSIDTSKLATDRMIGAEGQFYTLTVTYSGKTLYFGDQGTAPQRPGYGVVCKTLVCQQLYAR